MLCNPPSVLPFWPIGGRQPYQPTGKVFPHKVKVVRLKTMNAIYQLIGVPTKITLPCSYRIAARSVRELASGGKTLTILSLEGTEEWKPLYSMVCESSTSSRVILELLRITLYSVERYREVTGN